MKLVIDPVVVKQVAVGAAAVVCLLLAFPTKSARVRAIRVCRFLLGLLSLAFVVLASGYALQPEAFVEFWRTLAKNAELQRYLAVLGHPAAVMAAAGTFVGFVAQVFHAILDLANRVTVSKSSSDARQGDDRRDGASGSGSSGNAAS
jgi:hypothetical protein